MGYFGGSHGMRGDPGFFDTLKRLGGAVFRRSPLGAVAEVFRPPAGVSQRGTPTGFFRPGVGQQLQRVPTLGPGTAMVPFGRRRRRTNFANPKALRRAISRQNGFVRVAKGALKNSGFKVVSTSSGKVSRATMDKAVAKARADAHHAK